MKQKAWRTHIFNEKNSPFLIFLIRVFEVCLAIIFITTILIKITGYDKKIKPPTWSAKQDSEPLLTAGSSLADFGFNTSVKDNLTSGGFQNQIAQTKPNPPDISDFEASKKFYTIDPSENAYPDDTFLTAVKNIKECDYHSNSLYYYQRSTHGIPDLSAPNYKTIFEDIISNGWDEIKHKEMIPYIEVSESALEEIARGNDAKETKWLSTDSGMTQPCPSYKKPSTAGNLLCIKGKRHQRNHETNKAIECYSAALKIGGKFNSPGANLMSGLIGIYIQTPAIKCLKSILQNEELKKEQIKSIKNLAEETLKNSASVIDVFKIEYILMHNTIKETMDKIDKSAQSGSAKKTDAKKNAEYIEYTKETIKWNDEYSAHQIKYLELPFYERPEPVPQFEPDKKYNDANPILQVISAIARPNINEADVRYCANIAALRGLALYSAALLYKIDRGNFPDNPELLIPEYIDKIPDDPFTKNKIHYLLSSKTKTPIIWSDAADKKNNNAEILYDPSNGTFSPGDIIITEKK